MGANLLTFMANELNVSFTNLACQQFRLTNPVTLTRNGAGVAVAATFNTSVQTALMNPSRDVSSATRSQPMSLQEAGESEQRARAENDAGTSDAAKSGQAIPEAWRNKRFRLSVIAAAFLLAAGFAFGVGRVIGLGDTVILTSIPRPSTAKNVFIEDDNGIGADNQANILQSTAVGMVHVLSGGTSVGIGLVLTESGKVLTTYRPSAGATNLAAEYVISRATFKATVIGVDKAAGLALLQLEGGNGRQFSTVRSGTRPRSCRARKPPRQKSYHVRARSTSPRSAPRARENAVTLRCRHPDHPGHDRRRRQGDPERADGVGAAVCACRRRSAARW